MGYGTRQEFFLYNTQRMSHVQPLYQDWSVSAHSSVVTVGCRDILQHTEAWVCFTSDQLSPRLLSCIRRFLPCDSGAAGEHHYICKWGNPHLAELWGPETAIVDSSVRQSPLTFRKAAKQPASSFHSFIHSHGAIKPHQPKHTLRLSGLQAEPPKATLLAELAGSSVNSIAPAFANPACNGV